MQLDSTQIAIRERSFPDILDLSLRLIRTHALPLLVTSVLGAAPMIALDAWLLNSSVPDEYFELENLINYYVWLLWLISWQMPLASAWTTLYLGQALFLEHPSPRRMLQEFRESFPQFFLYQILLRGLLHIICVGIFVCYIGWPLMTEVILLERNPLAKKKSGGPSTGTRLKQLHGKSRGDLMGRWLASLIVSVVWLAAALMAAYVLRNMLTGNADDERVVHIWYVPVAIWAMISYFNVVRFLSYLDLRIRTEGWEIELRMRAEGARISRQLV